MDTERIVLDTVGSLSRELGASSAEPTLASSLESDLGIGSLERAELTLRLEQAVGHGLPGEELFGAQSVLDLVRLLGAGTGDQAAPMTGKHVFAPGPAPPEAAASMVDVLSYQAAQLKDESRVIFLRKGEVTARLSPSDIIDRARRVATGLHARGVQPGDRVALMLPTGPDFHSALFGVIWAGAAPVPLYPPWRMDQAEDYVLRQSAILQDCRAQVLVLFPEVKTLAEVLRPRAPALRHLVTLEELAREAPAAQRRARPEETVLIQYTSGSTGLPKGVVLSHANMLANLRAMDEGMAMDRHSVMVSWLPLYHDMGLIGKIFLSLYRGVGLVLMGPDQFLSRPSLWLRALSDFGGTISAAPNFAYEICARKVPDSELEGLDLSRWRIALNGAEPVRADTLERFTRRFEPCGLQPGSIFPAYGLAEATLAVAFPPVGRVPRIDSINRSELEISQRARPSQGPEAVRLVSCGRPLRGFQLQVVDGSGHALPERRQGHLQMRGPSVMQGYFGHPGRDADDWFDTGDLAYLAEGELYLTGRTRDLIIKAGRNLHPNDIEAVVDELDGVRPGCVAAFAMPGTSGTEELVVVAETRQSHHQDQLRERITQAVTRAIGVPPDRVELVPPRSIPKTPSGKVRRTSCRRALSDGSLGKRRGLATQALAILSGGRGYWLRRAVRAAAGGALAAWDAAALGFCSIFPLTTLLLRPQAARQVMRWASRAFLTLCGLRLKVEGNPRPEGPLMVVANHASLLDPVLLLATWEGPPLHVVVSKSVADHPFVRSFLTRWPNLVVTRGHRGAAEQAVESMAAALSRGDCLLIFPEGGVEAAPGIRTFATGAFRAAVQARARVLAVSLRGTRQALPVGEWVVRPGRLVASFQDPFAPQGSGWDAAVDLARRVRQSIADATGEPLLERRVSRRD